MKKYQRVLPVFFFAGMRIFIGILIILSATAVFAADSSLLAHYRMNESSGAMAYDSSGNSRHLTLFGGLGYLPGVSGSGLGFTDTSSKYAAMAAPDTALDFGEGDFSISFWVKFKAFTHEQALIEKLEGNGAPGKTGWLLTTFDETRVMFAASLVPAGMTNVEFSGLSLVTGTWHHFAIVRSGASLLLYLDGVQRGSQVFSGAIAGATAYPLLVGNRNADDGRSFPLNGMLDEVQIYSRALSASEIKAVAQGTIVTANYAGSRVSWYGAGDNGNAPASGVITGTASMLNGPTGSFVYDNELFAVNHNDHRITVYPYGAGGDLSPLRTLAGLNTGLSFPAHCFAVDGELFVTTASSLSVYNVSDSGDTPPKRSITTIPMDRGLTVSGSEAFVVGGAGTEIYVFDKSGNGTPAAKRVISGPGTGLTYAHGLAVHNGELFVGDVNAWGNSVGDAIRVFDVNASGDAAPIRVISGALTQLNGPASLWISAGELFVANYNGGQILVFDVAANGDVAPLRVITDPAYGLNPYGLSLHADPPDLSAWWQAEGDAIDVIGGRVASWSGAEAYGGGIEGTKAFSLGGSSYLSVPPFSLGTDWTLEAWVNPSGCSDGMHCPVISKSAGNNDGLLIAYLTGGHPNASRFVLDIGNGSSWDVGLASARQYAMNAWHHLAATKRNNVYTLYVNGEQAAQTTVSGASRNYDAENFELGYWNYGTDAILNGRIESIKVYTRALADADIRSAYLAATGPAAIPFRDEFVGTMRSEWRILNPNGPGMTVQPSSLRLLTSGSSQNLASVLLPNGLDGFAVVAKLRYQADPEDTQRAGVAVAADLNGSLDPANRVGVHYGSKAGMRRFMMDYYSGGIPVSCDGPLVGLQPGDPFWVRLVASGGTYIASYSLNGDVFIPFCSTYQVSLPWTSAYAGLYALQDGAVAPVAVDFDYFEVSQTCGTAPSDIISWWPGDSSASDALGRNHGVFMNGGLYAADGLRMGFRLDGVDDFVQVSSPDGIPVGNAPRSFSAWVRSFGPTAGNAFQGILSYGTYGSAGQKLYLERGGAGPADSLFSMMNGTADGSWNMQSQSQLNFGFWYHVAYTHDGTDSRLYVNGIQENSHFLPDATVMDGNGFRIGTSAPGDSAHGYFYGMIDDIMAYDRALSPAEIVALSAAGQTNACFGVAEIAVAKTDTGYDPVDAGGEMVYVITVTNNGPDAASGVILSDDIGWGFTYVDAVPSQGLCGYSEPTLSCDLGDLANNASATVTLTLTAPSAPGFVSNGVIAGSPLFDPLLANNQTDQNGSVQTVLTVAVNDAAAGSVTGATGIDCPGTCVERFGTADQISLMATGATGYKFVNWTGDLPGTTNPLVLTMDQTRTVTANFRPNLVRLVPDGTQYFLTISAAYAAAGDVEIQMQAVEFPEDPLEFYGASRVILSGGFDTDFAPGPIPSIINGAVMIGGTGSVTINNIAVK